GPRRPGRPAGGLQPGHLPGPPRLVRGLRADAAGGDGLCTPVVASSSSSLPEVVGGARVLVDPADGEGRTDALERVCGDADLQATLHRRGLLRASEFTWSRAAQRTWQVLTRVARTSR